MKNKQYIYRFSKNIVDGNRDVADILGGKGANLAEMCNLNIPVPPGFTVSTEVCNYFLKNNSFPKNFEKKLLSSVDEVESNLGLRFGGVERPLLFSVRSGGRQSMPGMMETVLNVGLTNKTIPGLISQTNDERFVYDSYRRLIMMYADVVMEKANNLNSGIRERLDLILIKVKRNKNITHDYDLSAADLKEICLVFKKEIYKVLKSRFPDDPHEQLWGAIRAVFVSWNGFRAREYRRIEKIPDSWGTAVSVQSMVFGNMGDRSATGVAFTRNPSNGDDCLYGEWLPNAQGEDVVAGIRTPYPINTYSKNWLTKNKKTLESAFPSLYKEILKIKKILENHYSDMQDLEFTIQQGKLWMLQTRSGKRNGLSAIKIAVDLYNQKMIGDREIISRISCKQIEEVMHPSFNLKEEKLSKIVTTGLPAGPGCATGIAVFSPDRALMLAKAGERVVLIREETSPEDIHGMNVSSAIITSRGGVTSHAALVARGWGKCCVVGCGEIIVNIDSAKINGNTIVEGDCISVNGSSGNIYLNKIKLVSPQPNKNNSFVDLFKILIPLQKIGVRSNADTPEDAINAKNMGAKGIGLCRTEHMFFEPKKLLEVRKMIVFRSDKKRRERAIMKLLPFQKKDFYEILKAMSPHPVTIRLLDPPLHEFLPVKDSQISELANQTRTSKKTIVDNISKLHENNPMLGHRGCRLGISYPEITIMQATSIFEACSELYKKGIEAFPEIMIPLVGTVKEFDHQKAIIKRCVAKVEAKNNFKATYKIGTMIELPRACLDIEKIAKSADFLSFGTNDLTQTTFGFSRDDVSDVLKNYIEEGIIEEDPFQTIDLDGVGKLIELAVIGARKVSPKIKIGVCGEHGGDPKSIDFFKKCGIDYVSCSPFRVPSAILCATQ